MNTPIYDFVKSYSLSGAARFHMPGHKGKSLLGCEHLDITEIDGADVLYSPEGIIAESEQNASELFGSEHTYYSTEGSTLAIKVMLALATRDSTDGQPLVLASRNAHKAFLHACALLDIDVQWMIGGGRSHLCSCRLSADELETFLSGCEKKPSAVYVTSPDYMGNILDIAALSRVCHAHGVPLLVDNAHGAYLAFTEPSLHPLALGADICCDSAHKTLPVLTGGAYLHISKNAPDSFKDLHAVRSLFSLFASTSPSYLILQSLDLCNRYLHDGYRQRLGDHIKESDELKRRLSEHGYNVLPSEPLKLVISCNEYGYTGTELASILRSKGIECEFSDKEYAVFMTTPENSHEEMDLLFDRLIRIERSSPISHDLPDSLTVPPKPVISIRKAVLSPRESLPVDAAEGRICAVPTVSCPPAIPIAVSGEIITREHISLFKAYEIEEIEVCK